MRQLQEGLGDVGMVEWFYGPGGPRHEVNQRESRSYSTTIAIVRGPVESFTSHGKYMPYTRSGSPREGMFKKTYPS